MDLTPDANSVESFLEKTTAVDAAMSHQWAPQKLNTQKTQSTPRLNYHVEDPSWNTLCRTLSDEIALRSQDAPDVVAIQVFSKLPVTPICPSWCVMNPLE